MPNFNQTRAPSHAGQFYPASAAPLRKAVADYLAAGPAPSPGQGQVRALVSPHAGYMYSGATAGRAYARLGRRPDIRRVLLLAPSHYAALHGISVGDYARLATPLGELPVAVERCRDLLAASPLFVADKRTLAREHALEVQLPFIQSVLPQAEVIPAVCGDLAPGELRQAAAVLREQCWNPETLWIISTDFTHYGADFDYVPFTGDVPKRLRELDLGAVRPLRELNPDAFLDYVARTGATICGYQPLALLLVAAAPDKAVLATELLDYTTSGELTHDFTCSVSYVALAVTEAPAAVAATAADEGPLSKADQARLLKLARDTIQAYLRRQPLPKPAAAELSPALQADGACFVTLEMGGNLRGCIGALEAEEPLFRNVMHNAINAAVHDPRFAPLKLAELAEVDLEISVLTAPRPIAGPDEFVVGRHGIILEKGRYGAVFLPQVPPEEGWDKDTTLTQLALKAGLGPDGWRRGASFSVFEAIVFGETQKK